MSDGKPSKWEQKQRAAKAAEAKFEENQARGRKHGKKRGSKKELDDVGSALGDVEIVNKVGVLGWLVGHKAVLGILVVLAAGGVIFGMCKCINYRLKTIPGWPRTEVFVAGTGTLILIDHVEVGGTDSEGNPQAPSGKGERLTAIDVMTGKQLAVEVTEYKECWPGVTRLICANIYDQIELLEPATLAVAATANDLIAEAKLAKPTRRYERIDNAVIVVLEDGRGAKIVPAPLEVTSLPTVERSTRFPPSSSEPRCSTDSRLKVDATTLIFQSGTRNALTSDPPPPAESATPSGPPLSYLDGGFLRGVGLPIVLSKQTMDKPEQIVSRVDGIAKERWSVGLGGACHHVWILSGDGGDRLVAATGNASRRALSIDLATGKVLWTFGR